jgi:hypothetical protein
MKPRPVVARAQRIGVRVKECVDAAVLIVLEDLPVGAARDHDRVNYPGGRTDGSAEIPPADPGHEHHHRTAQSQQQGGAKVGLLQHQQHRHGDQQRWRQHP